jgi:peroxiredoxin
MVRKFKRSWTLIAAVVACPVVAAPLLAQTRARGPAEKAPPAQRVTNYRPLGPAATTPAVIPPVLLSKEQEALCTIKVGDVMPAMTLNQVRGRQVELAGLFGKTATVVAFWRTNRRMARTLLADLKPDVIDPFGAKGVAVVGIAVDEPASAAGSALERAQANFANLLDPGGKAYALVGKERLPRVYLLDSQGKVLWFDIEYSLATRRELNQALRAVTSAQQ